jgi:integrase
MRKITNQRSQAIVGAPSARAVIPLLDPHTLHADTAAAVSALLKEGTSANTQRSYATALRYWAAWYRLRFGEMLALPVSVPAVLQFIADHALRSGPEGVLAHELPAAIDAALVAGEFKGRPGAPKHSTLRHRIAVLSKAHTARGLVNATRDPAVQELLARVRRIYAARGTLRRSKRALTREPLEALLATCTDGLLGVRDRALLLFGFASGGRRRIEIATAVMENLIRLDDGTYVYRLTHSKTSQAGDDPNADKPVVGRAATALAAWLSASGITRGVLFRRVRGSSIAEPLSGQAVWRIVRRRAALAGLENEFGAHSLRSGFVTEAGRQNVNPADAQALTGHRSVQMFMSYYQTGSVTRSRAANLLEDAEDE